MLEVAKNRKLPLEYLLFNSWYRYLDNLKSLLKKISWQLHIILKSKWRLNPYRTGLRPINRFEIITIWPVVHFE